MENSGSEFTYFEDSAFLEKEISLLGKTYLSKFVRSQSVFAGRLLDQGKIGLPELMAIERWYKDYILAHNGISSCSDLGRVRGSGNPGSISDRVLEAVTSHRIATLALGKDGNERMVALIANGITLTDFSQALHVAPRKLSALFVADLKLLASHYTISR